MSTKLNPPNHTNLPNIIYKTKSTKPDPPHQISQTNLTEQNQIYVLSIKGSNEMSFLLEHL